MAGEAQEANGRDSPIERLRRFVHAELGVADAGTVLDAGCGFRLPFEFPPGLRFVGLDTSAEALAKNTYIDSAIVGDVETYPLPAGEYDAVLCWWVLEHVPHPRAAVANMARALKPGGLLIVGLPNIWSLKGLVTKLTPYRFHVWVYRRLLGYNGAGEPGQAPFRTYLRWQISPHGLSRLAEAERLELVYSETFSMRSGLPKRLEALWSAAVALGPIVTLGAWNSSASEHVAVFRKPLPRTSLSARRSPPGAE